MSGGGDKYRYGGSGGKVTPWGGGGSSRGRSVVFLDSIYPCMHARYTWHFQRDFIPFRVFRISNITNPRTITLIIMTYHGGALNAYVLFT